MHYHILVHAVTSHSSGNVSSEMKVLGDFLNEVQAVRAARDISQKLSGTFKEEYLGGVSRERIVQVDCVVFTKG